VVIGGVFTLLGGYLGSRLLIRDERRGLRREFLGAIHVTRSELGRNASSIEWRLDHNDALNLTLSDHRFRSVEAVLAQNLPGPLFIWLSVVNEQMMRLQEGIDEDRNRHSRLGASQIAVIQNMRERLLAAVGLLVRYLDETMKSPIDDFTEFPNDPQEIEARLEATLFPPPPKWQIWKRRPGWMKVVGWIVIVVGGLFALAGVLLLAVRTAD
jgi:hypothetical protein